MGKRANRGARYNLGDDVDTLLADYCEAMLEIDVSKVLRAALKDFIPRELAANEGIRRRYEEARKARLKTERPDIHVLHPGKK